MELTREHARQGIRLVKRQQTDLKLTSMTTSEIIDICTETALSLQGGTKPKWYDESISHSSRKSSQKRDQPSSSSCPPISTGGAALTGIDENAIKPDLTDDGTTSPTSTNDTSSTETSLESRNTSSQASMLSSDRLTNETPFSLTESPLTFERSRSVTPLLSERRIPSSGLITTLTPSPVLGLPPIRMTLRRPFTGIESREMLKKQMLTRIEVNPEKPSNRRKEVKQEEKRKKKAISKPAKKQGNEMDKLEVVSEYWNIPFDPLREGVISDHKICNIPELEDEEEASMNKKDVLLDMDYWEIQKILRFVRIGNPTATVLALCVLKEMDLNKPSCKEIIHHLNGISLFLNILDTKNYRCRVAALKVLVLMASSKTTSTIILRKNGIQQFVSILEENDRIAMSITCDVLSLLARHNSVRAVANRLDIIRKLMTVFQTCVKATLKGENLTLCQHVCRALWRFSKSIREQDVTYVSESLAVISHLIFDTQKEALVVPLLGVVEECASVESFRCQMEKENFIEKVMWKVESKERTVQVLCVKIMFKCVGDRKFQRMLLKSNSLQHLMNLLKENVHESNDELLMLLLGIVWRCSVNQKHRKKFENFRMFPLLVEILKSNKNLQVKSAALGVLSEFLWDDFYTESVVNHGAVNLLIKFMTSTEPSILVNSARCLGVCARNRSWRGIILQLDGLRLLWSLLKSYNDEVLASGAVAVASVCACPKESANAVRSIVGGVELLMSLITSIDLTKHKVLICLCQAATNIAQDAENLSILTDYGLISALLRLYETKDKILRYYVTCLIERCCEAKTERNILSKCIPFLVEGLGNGYDDHVHCTSICALNQLSRDLTNCVFLREPHTTKTLLNLLGSSNERIQDAAAGCLANVRKSMTVT